MKFKVVYSRKAVEALGKLSEALSSRIVKKIRYFGGQENPLHFAKKLQDRDFGQYRFRIGDYRVLFDVEADGQINIILIITVKHRKDAYLE